MEDEGFLIRNAISGDQTELFLQIQVPLSTLTALGTSQVDMKHFPCAEC